MAEELKNGFERHAQTAIQVVITALLLWVGNAVLTLRDSSIRLEEKQVQSGISLIRMEAEFTMMRNSLANITSTLHNTASITQDHERRISKMEAHREALKGKR